MNLFDACVQALASCDPRDKTGQVDRLAAAWRAGGVVVDAAGARLPVPSKPGRPDRPELIDPRDVPRRGMGTPEGRTALVHAVAHIEFNAINLALDACARFREMPPAYYADWLQVAAEESVHFRLLDAHLGRLGHAYGDFTAHDGLWEMAEQTAHDVVARMGLVPRVLEARGLDVTPAMRDGFARAGDPEAASILDIILRDEVGHVATGSRWFAYECERRGLPAEATCQHLITDASSTRVRLPINRPARIAGGFTATELDWLEARARSFRTGPGGRHG